MKSRRLNSFILHIMYMEDINEPFQCYDNKNVVDITEYVYRKLFKLLNVNKI